MTSNTHFQELVRARMAKTGERYSTARTHVLHELRTAREVEPFADIIVPGYPGFGGGASHDSALNARVLEQAGVVSPLTGEPFTEAMLAGLGGGIGFMLFVFQYPGLTTTTIICRFHPGPFVENLRRRAGADVRISRTSSARVAARALDEAMHAQRAAICTVTGSLPWNPSSDGAFYDYDVAVVGVDPVRQLAIIDDRAEIAMAMPIADLAQARASRKKARQQLVWFEPASEDFDLAEQIHDAIADTTTALTAEKSPPGIPAHFAKNFGLAGMRQWQARMRDDRTKKGWPRIFGDPASLFTCLTRVHDCLHRDFGAADAMRPLFAEFCEEAATSINEPALAEAAAIYRQAAGHWRSLSEVALPDDVPELATYRALFDRRRERSLAGEPIDDVQRDAEALRVAFTERCPWDAGGIAAHFGAIAAALDAVIECETQGAAVLAQVSPPRAP